MAVLWFYILSNILNLFIRFLEYLTSFKGIWFSIISDLQNLLIK